MHRNTGSKARDRTFAAWLALLATTATLVALALAASGTVLTASIVMLGLLIPAVAIVASATERRRVGHRISLLETEIQREREAGQRHHRFVARLTDEVQASATAVHRLSRHLKRAGIRDVAEAEELIAIISHDATEILRTIENTAAAAQIDAGTYRPKPVVVELEHHVKRVVEAIGCTPIEISVDVREAAVWCDPAAIRLTLLNVLHTAVVGGASTARIDVEERNGLGILSITDDRDGGHYSDHTPSDLLGTGDTRSGDIISALVESQGGTMNSARTLGWSSTVIRLPLATPAQLSSSTEASITFDASRTI